MTNDAESRTEDRPSRGWALFLSLIGPAGTGQFYLGRPRRALFWLLVPPAVFLVALALLPAFGAVAGFRIAFGAIALAAIATGIASLVDLYRIPEERLRRAGGWKVFGYWVAGILFAAARRPAW